jgi:hypothetical protein
MRLFGESLFSMRLDSIFSPQIHHWPFVERVPVFYLVLNASHFLLVEMNFGFIILKASKKQHL